MDGYSVHYNFMETTICMPSFNPRKWPTTRMLAREFKTSRIIRKSKNHEIKVTRNFRIYSTLEHHRKSAYTYNGRSFYDHSSTFIFEWIFLSFAGIKDTHKSLNELEYPPHSTTNYRFSCTWASKLKLYNVVTTLAPSFFICFFLILLGYRESMDRSDPITDYRVSCPWASENILSPFLFRSF